MKVSGWLTDSVKKLGLVNVGTTRLDALILLEDVTGKNRAWLLAHPETALSSVQLKKLNSLVARRVKREPLAYILGRVEFYGLTLEVNRQVLIPRPETESLINYALDHAPQGATVLDVGTGSGAIAIALKHTRPDLAVMASDISAPALEVARRNAAKYRISDIYFRQSNLMDDISGRFDVIVANLPYVPTKRQLEPELTHEPRLALNGGPDGLELYRQLLSQITPYLNARTLVVFEAEPAQHDQLIAAASLAGSFFENYRKGLLLALSNHR